MNFFGQIATSLAEKCDPRPKMGPTFRNTKQHTMGRACYNCGIAGHQTRNCDRPCAKCGGDHQWFSNSARRHPKCSGASMPVDEFAECAICGNTDHKYRQCPDYDEDEHGYQDPSADIDDEDDEEPEQDDEESIPEPKTRPALKKRKTLSTRKTLSRTPNQTFEFEMSTQARNTFNNAMSFFIDDVRSEMKHQTVMMRDEIESAIREEVETKLVKQFTGQIEEKLQSAVGMITMAQMGMVSKINLMEAEINHLKGQLSKPITATKMKFPTVADSSTDKPSEKIVVQVDADESSA